MDSFSSIKALILCRMYGFSMKSAQIIQEKIIKNGGRCSILGRDSIDFKPSHIIAPKSIPGDALNEKLGEFLSTPDIYVVSPDWAYNSLQRKLIEPEEIYQLASSLPIKRSRPPQKPADRLESSGELEASMALHKRDPCSFAPEGSRAVNAHITDEIEKLQRHVETLGDRGRAISYAKLLRLIRLVPEPITHVRQIENIKGIGPKHVEKVLEILESGALKKVQRLEDDKRILGLEFLTSIHGIGSAMAHSLYAKKLDSIEKLRAFAKENSQEFTETQLECINLYEELMEKIPRDEVVRVAALVKEELFAIDSTALFEICGSFRRGRELCGDMDFVVGTHDRDGLLGTLVGKLTKKGLITHQFTHKAHTFLGLAKLEGGLHRRLDIFCVNIDTWAFSLVSYTGSKNYNKMMRFEAKKKGWRMSHTELIDRATGKHVLLATSEQEIIEFLGLPYLTPEQRDL